jgi:transketolase
MPVTAAPLTGMHAFGACAPLKELLTKFGFTPSGYRRPRERVAAAGRGYLSR